jgi:hypothetical protein
MLSCQNADLESAPTPGRLVSAAGSKVMLFQEFVTTVSGCPFVTVVLYSWTH